MARLKSLVEPIRAHWRAYLALNVAYYGLVIVGMLFVATQPGLQQALLGEVQAGFSSGGLAAVVDAYVSGNLPQAIALTFVVNLLLGTVVYITLPSVFLPFLGVLTGLFRALLWGLILSPTSPELQQMMATHWVVAVLEGQGYILAMFGAYVLWAKALGFGGAKGDFGQRYIAGLGAYARVYLLVIAVLLVAALYEALEVIYLVGGA